MNLLLPTIDKSPIKTKEISYRIKLKSIHEERALNRTVKLNKSADLFLTNHKFKNYDRNQSSLNGNNQSIELKTNINSLQIEIAEATSKALLSIKDYQSIKSSHASTQRNNMITKDYLSVSITNKSNISTQTIQLSNEESSEIKNLTEQNLNSLNKKNIDINTASSLSSKSVVSANVIKHDLQEDCHINTQQSYIKCKRNSDNKDNNLNLNDLKLIGKNSKQESIFIDKIKEATIKLRKLRELTSKTEESLQDIQLYLHK